LSILSTNCFGFLFATFCFVQIVQPVRANVDVVEFTTFGEQIISVERKYVGRFINENTKLKYLWLNTDQLGLNYKIISVSLLLNTEDDYIINIINIVNGNRLVRDSFTRKYYIDKKYNFVTYCLVGHFTQNCRTEFQVNKILVSFVYEQKNIENVNELYHQVRQKFDEIFDIRRNIQK
jgi:hypothetical protein